MPAARRPRLWTSRLACGLPAWKDAREPMPDWHLFTQPDRDVEFDQCVP